jgi:hypothetical protein
MQPMGSKDEAQAIRDELARIVDQQQQEAPSDGDSGLDQTEIAYPEARYGIACIGCGIESHLQMIPHREQYGVLVGWVFCCEKCRPNIIGRRMRWGDMDEVQGSIFAGVLEATDAAASEIAKLEAKQRANWIAYIFEALETELTEAEMHSLLVESVLGLEQRLQAGRW